MLYHLLVSHQLSSFNISSSSLSPYIFFCKITFLPLAIYPHLSDHRTACHHLPYCVRSPSYLSQFFLICHINFLPLIIYPHLSDHLPASNNLSSFVRFPSSLSSLILNCHTIPNHTLQNMRVKVSTVQDSSIWFFLTRMTLPEAHCHTCSKYTHCKFQISSPHSCLSPFILIPQIIFLPLINSPPTTLLQVPLPQGFLQRTAWALPGRQVALSGQSEH